MNRFDPLSPPMPVPAFTFATPPRLVVGWGAATNGPLAAEAARIGSKPLLIVGRSLRESGTLDTILATFHAAGLFPTVHEGVPPEPDLTAVQAAMDATVHAGCDSVVAIGGGSVLDVAKGAAALAKAGGTIRDYFRGQRTVPETGGLPLIAVPTTSGTGSEVTWVGVYTDKTPDGGGLPRKLSIRGGAMMPRVAVLDAQLTVSCPPNVTAQSGMDAFVQAVEAFTSVGANPLTDALALQAAQLASYHNVAFAVTHPTDRAAREAVALGSLMAGMALNTSRLGLVHGLAHPVGARTGAAHGLLCGMLLPAVVRFNRDAAAAKYARLAVAVTGNADSDAFFAAIDATLYGELGFPRRLSEIGLTPADLDDMAAEAMVSGSTKANPRPVSLAAARAVLEACG